MNNYPRAKAPDDEALHELQTLGATILKSAIPQELVAALATAVDEARAYLEREAKDELYRINQSLLASPAHIGFLCPFTDPFCHRDLITSERLMTLLEGYLGPGFFLEEYVVNVSLAGGSTAQKIHVDQETDELGTVGVACNVAITETGPTNGMLKMWLSSQGVTERDMALLDQVYVSSQPTLAPGDVLVRDLSLIHHGVPNPSPVDRNLIALVYQPRRWQPAESVRGDIPAREWQGWTEQQRNIMRRHRVVEDEIVHPRPYPIPVAAYE